MCDDQMCRKVAKMDEPGHEDMLGFPRLPAPLPEQVMYKPFFDLVADKANWKKPIDAMVDAPSGKEDRELFKKLISQAVIFYAGCVPLIVDLGDKQIGVKAVGYYEAVGA